MRKNSKHTKAASRSAASRERRRLARFGFFLVAFLVSSCSQPEITNPEQTAGTFFPLTQGSWWKYSASAYNDGPAHKTMDEEVRVLRPDQYPKEMPDFARKDNVAVFQRTNKDISQDDWQPHQGNLSYSYYVLKDGFVVELMADEPHDRSVLPHDISPTPSKVVPVYPSANQTWDAAYGRSQKVDPSFIYDWQKLRVGKSDSNQSTYKKGVGLISQESHYNNGSVGGWGGSRIDLIDSHVEKGSASTRKATSSR